MLLSILTLLAATTPDDVIPAAKARDHLNQRLTVEMTVKASKSEVDRNVDFLDSEADYRSPSNLAVVIPHNHLPAFRSAGIDNPAAYYFEKTIRVTGTVIHKDEQTRIRVTDPAQIVIVEPRLDVGADARPLADRLAAIRDAYDAELEALRLAVQKLPTDKEQMQYYSRHAPDVPAYARRMIDLALTDPKKPASRDALLWVIDHPNRSDSGPYADEFARAAQILTRHHGNDPEAVRIGLGLDNVLTPRRDTLLFGLLASAKDHEPMGLARLALGEYLLKMSDFASNARKNPGRQTYRFEGYDENGDLRPIDQVESDDDYAYRLQLALRDPDAIRAEGIRLLEDVAAHYADVPYIRHRDRELERLLAQPEPKWNGQPIPPDDLKKLRDKLAHPRTLAEIASAKLDELRNLAIGQPAPEIDGPDMNGNSLKLSDHRGKVVVFVFWGTWCGPCMAEVPHERELVERLKDRPFALLGVDCDEDPDIARQVMKKENMTWPNWHDGAPGDGPIQQLYHVEGYPTTLVLDAQGIIRHKNLRGDAPSDAVDALLAESPSTTPGRIPTP